jgi:alkyl hydroperoxide reductase subunit D
MSDAATQAVNLETLLAGVPDHAKDLRLNLSSVLKQSELTEQQAWGTAVATAIASRNPQLTAAVLAEAAQHLSPENMRAAKAAASIMGMNNIYYRFQHLTTNERYREIPARLRMQVRRGFSHHRRGTCG